MPSLYCDLSKKLFLMIYQPATELGSPFILFKVKSWKPPDLQNDLLSGL